MAPSSQAAAAKLQRHAISANGMEGRRERRRNPSAVGEEEAMSKAHSSVFGRQKTPPCLSERPGETRMGHPLLRDSIFRRLRDLRRLWRLWWLPLGRRGRSRFAFANFNRTVLIVQHNPS